MQIQPWINKNIVIQHAWADITDILKRSAKIVAINDSVTEKNFQLNPKYTQGYDIYGPYGSDSDDHICFKIFFKSRAKSKDISSVDIHFTDDMNTVFHISDIKQATELVECFNIGMRHISKQQEKFLSWLANRKTIILMG